VKRVIWNKYRGINNQRKRNEKEWGMKKIEFERKKVYERKI
jgi:hypothetical protein